MELGILHVEATAAGAPATIPEGHLEYHKDTDKLYKSNGAVKTELAAGVAFTTEDAQDAVGAMIDTSLTYVDATPLLKVTAMTGDVTSTGANVTTIGNDKVTYAKMQNVSATDRLLGRDTAGAGDVEELTVTSGVEFSGSTGIIASSRVLNVDSSLLIWDTSAAETTIYSYTIPASTLGSSDIIRTIILNDYLNNTGSGKGYITKVKLGGTTVIEFDTGANFVTSGTRRQNQMIIYINALGATNSQRVTLRMDHASGGGLFGTVTTGTGAAMSTTTSTVMLHSGTLSQDMTTSKVFEVSITLSTSNINHGWSSWSGVTELLSV